MAASSRGAVIAAVFGNGFITIIKFVAFLHSGSGAMLSESIHSLADTGNQALLFLGIRRSERPADAMFHYGYGADRFLFALLSAVGIFILGCGVTIYHGIHTLIHPPVLELGWVSFAVLGVSFVIEGAVLLSAVRAVSAAKGEMTLWRFIRTSSDPTVLAVLFEDFVACVGVVVALVGITLARVTGNPIFDALSSILIGLMLGAIAIWLGYRNRQLVLGQAIPRDMESEVVALIRSQPSVQSMHDVKSRVIGADRYKLKAEVDFDGRFLARGHLEWARAQAPDPSDEPAFEAFVLELGERMMESLGDEIDRIEGEIVERFPRLKHLDLETE